MSAEALESAVIPKGMASTILATGEDPASTQQSLTPALLGLPSLSCWVGMVTLTFLPGGWG